MNKSIITIIVVSVIVGGGAFYGGMKYAENKSPAGQFSRGDFSAGGGSAFGGQNLSPEERQQRFQELGASVGSTFGGDHEGGSRFGSRAGGSQPLSGEVISQSNDSLTIQLSDGSTRIVFVSDSTQITKSVNGTIDDLSEGEQIFISGDENPDGSYTAQTVQLR